MSTNPFRELRKEKNPSLMEDYKAKDLAKDLGIPAPKISEPENNKRDASLTELKAYHKYFNVPYEYLLKENNSRYYEYMQLSTDIGLSGTAIKTLHDLCQNPIYVQLLNILINKYLSSLLAEISNGVQYMDLLNNVYLPSYNKEKLKSRNEAELTADKNAMEALQKITNETGVILRLISGNENINYCQLRAGEIIRKAVGEILYHWERDYS